MNGFKPELDYEDIDKEVRRLCKLIGEVDRKWITFGESNQFATPHIEIDSEGYHFVVCERGQELSRQTTQNPDQLCCWIMTGIAKSLGMFYESSNRNERQDPRRIMFAKSLELLGKLSPSWAQRLEVQYADILIRHPYDDESYEKRYQANAELKKELGQE